LPAITEQIALEILQELIRKPESKAEDIPRIWGELISLYTNTFAPATEPAKKKRRKRSTNPSLGWPQGVSRAEYAAWKDSQLARGITEGINPQAYKLYREQEASAPAQAVAVEARPKASAPAQKAAKDKPAAKAAATPKPEPMPVPKPARAAAKK
jgi:hypothetical protein